jgi:hypothetical protein
VVTRHLANFTRGRKFSNLRLGGASAFRFSFAHYGVASFRSAKPYVSGGEHPTPGVFAAVVGLLFGRLYLDGGNPDCNV